LNNGGLFPGLFYAMFSQKGYFLIMINNENLWRKSCVNSA